MLNPLYIGGLLHFNMFDESICHFRGVGSNLLLLFFFDGKILLANKVNLIRRHMMWHLVWVCLPMTFLMGFQAKMGSFRLVDWLFWV